MVDGTEIPRIELRHRGRPKTYWRMGEKYKLPTSIKTLTHISKSTYITIFDNNYTHCQNIKNIEKFSVYKTYLKVSIKIMRIFFLFKINC